MHVKDKDFSSFLEGNLSVEKQKRTERHFSVCAQCRRRLKQWEKLYQSIDTLDYDFELEGLEEKIIQRIKTEPLKETVVGPVIHKLTALNLAFFFVLIITASMFFSPVINIANQMAQYSAGLIFNQGLNWINEVKWRAVDIIGAIQAMEMSLLPLSAGIMLMVGGTYFSISSKPARKVT